MPDNLATTPQKNRLQDHVVALINDTYQATSAAAVQSKRYLTGDNRFVYLTYSHVQTPEIAPIKIQVFQRVDGGVKETIYRLYSDQRLTCEHNDMIFGQMPDKPQEGPAHPVTESEATDLCATIDSLGADNERLQWGTSPGGGSRAGEGGSTLDDGAIT